MPQDMTYPEHGEPVVIASHPTLVVTRCAGCGGTGRHHTWTGGSWKECPACGGAGAVKHDAKTVVT